MSFEIITGGAKEMLQTLPNNHVNTIVTSPPYFGLRDYGNDAQIGLEATPELFIQNLVEVFRECKRVLRDDGTLWVNISDTYNGNKKGNTETHKNKRVSEQNNHEKKLWDGAKPKDLIGIPWMLAFALRADGWYLRSEIIWAKANPMPESVTDRPTKAHEQIFLLSKSPKYYYDHAAIMEKSVSQDSNKRDRISTQLNKVPGRTKMAGLVHNDYEKRNKRSVWEVNTKPFKNAHFATFPVKLITPCVLAGCPVGGVVLDPFCGAATTGIAALNNDRSFIGIELNPDYAEMGRKRIIKHMGIFA